MNKALVAFITGSPAVSALVGTRLYPDILPEPCTYPAATYRGISLVDMRTLDENGMTQFRIEIQAWGQTRSSADDVATALFELLDDYSGPLPGGLIADITRDSERSGFDETLRRFYVQTDWMFQVTA